jgi:hypothetical protein
MHTCARLSRGGRAPSATLARTFPRDLRARSGARPDALRTRAMFALAGPRGPSLHRITLPLSRGEFVARP